MVFTFLSLKAVSSKRELWLCFFVFCLIGEEVVDVLIEFKNIPKLMFERDESEIESAIDLLGLMQEKLVVVSDSVLPFAGLSGIFKSFGEVRTSEIHFEVI